MKLLIKRTVLLFLFLNIIFFGLPIHAGNSIDINMTVPASPSADTGGDSNPPPLDKLEINNLTIKDVSYSSATISWLTNRVTVCKISWGDDPIGDNNMVSEKAYSREHNINVTNLRSGWEYVFSISCDDNKNNNTSIKQTIIIPFIQADVSNLQAIAYKNSIQLKWANPDNEDFLGVKVFRLRTGDYSNIQQDKILIYDGVAENYTDIELTSSTIYYYYLYAYNQKNKLSSGMMIFARTIQEDKGDVKENDSNTNEEKNQNETNLPPIDNLSNGYPGGTIAKDPASEGSGNKNIIGKIEDLFNGNNNDDNKSEVTEKKVEKIEDFEIGNIEIIKNNQIDLGDKKSIKGYVGDQILVFIPLENIPNNVDKIILTLNIDNTSNNKAIASSLYKTFVFTYDQTRRGYFVDLTSDLASGNYSFKIDFFDKKNNLLKEIDGGIVMAERDENIFQKVYQESSKYDSIILLATILFIIILVIRKYILKKKKI